METLGLNRYLDLKGGGGVLGDKTSPVTLGLRHQLLPQPPQPPLASTPTHPLFFPPGQDPQPHGFCCERAYISLLKAYFSPTTVLGKPVTLAVPWAPRDLY